MNKKGDLKNVVTFILVILFAIFASFESASYGLYELRINKNKAGGILLLLLSLIGLVFPIVTYLNI